MTTHSSLWPRVWCFSADPLFPKMLGEQFNIITNAQFYWSEVEPQPGVFDFSSADIVADFASAHNQSMRCHNLVWDQVRLRGSAQSLVTAMTPHCCCRPYQAT